MLRHAWAVCFTPLTLLLRMVLRWRAEWCFSSAATGSDASQIALTGKAGDFHVIAKLNIS
ncbi:hypothetical protein [Undibacterium sp. TC9W]|uniref:hypothetical protein n=1 Tax=Undibacterium sp. TC9W TaxID=3413053 RepID=UPI003BF0AAB6